MTTDSPTAEPTPRGGDLLIRFGPLDDQLGVDLIEDWLDQVDGDLVAAAVNDAKFSHS